MQRAAAFRREIDETEMGALAANSKGASPKTKTAAKA
jgi:hypothetical protein